MFNSAYMVELIQDLPANAVGFHAYGEVSKDDYQTVVIPAVDRLAAGNTKINFLLVLDTDVSDFTPGGIFNDILLGFKHFTKWNKVAIVSDLDKTAIFFDSISTPLPGETRRFSKNDIKGAKEWLSS
jgi:hypothetical protein